MFERYTEKARRVIFFARYEASQFGTPAIEPEHVLLGLMREDRTLNRYFPRVQFSIESIRKEIEHRTLLREKISTSVELPLAPETKRVLAYAHEESERLLHRHIGTEHLLLGLMREERSMAAEILYERGLRLNSVRSQIALISERGFDIVQEALMQRSVSLDLSHRSLDVVPASVSHLKWLQRLDLSGNRLKSLPEFIGQLSQLEYLNVSNNSLTTLPDSLLSLRALDVLYLHGNEGLNLPIEILGPPEKDDATPEHPTRILEYYYRVNSPDGQRSLNEAKLILVGRGSVGKTSLINRLLFNVFRPEKRTDGIQITKWNLRLEGNELIRLNVWDFGGQEILHATHQFFLTRRSLYLLVLTGREGMEDTDAEYWLKLIESFGGDSPVIIVMNKINEYPFDVNRRALMQKYPNIRDFVKTDCEDEAGLPELRKVVERETDRLEYLRTSFPQNWFEIKEEIALMRRSYLSFDEYRALCARLGEKDREAQEALSVYFHSLGIALNYKDDPRLQDTHILNPHWVTNGIYKVLSSTKLKEGGGEIRLTDLPEILDDNNYPVRMHRFLFDLMRKFELCFSFPDDEYHYLIPELLDKQESPGAMQFDPEKCLNFQYHYSVLPEGLLPRFIVRTHVLSSESARWRSGVILKFEGNRALVKADIQEKRVFISVSGTPAGRRRLLAIIRSDFEHIHRNFRNLHPKEMVPLPEDPNALVPYEKLLAMEREGIEAFPEFSGGRVVSVDVNALLNGIDIEGVGLRPIMNGNPGATVQLFYSYSHRDERLRDELETHLKLLQRQGLIKSWFDRNISAGDDWRRRIDENLERADIVLLLVSADFIGSDYCYEKEMKRALERHAQGETQIIPIIVRDVDLSETPFSGIQWLPQGGRAVMLWKRRDSAWRNVAEGIRVVANRILEQKRAG